ncbi:DUF1488 domain-containing protein [Vibrio sp. WXL210]|uniref:DUF1488 domain-containing protein n=1 Tax=Vibrio sp. WXL210 TaxID=3450709 RepID=UPI003EC9172C
MNQSILFPDMQTWDSVSQRVIFPAQQGGALIECVISLVQLEKMVSRSLEGEAEVLKAFAELRFDLEEWAEQQIEDEEFNSQGQIELS